MADYRNSVDEANLQNFGFKNTLEQQNKLAQMIQQKNQQQQQASEFQQSQQQQRDMPGIEQKAKGDEMGLQRMLTRQDTDDNLAKATGIVSDNARKGVKINAKVGNVDVSQSEQNVFMQGQKNMDQEGRILAANATKAYKPIDDQAQAVKATVQSLNAGNPTGDSAAIMNEVKALSGSSRGMLGLMQALGGHPTAATKMQDAMNFVNNTAQSGLQPAQRDAMREFAFSRVGQLQQQHQQITDTLKQTAPSYAHSLASSGQLPGLVDSYGAGPKQALSDIGQMSQAYSKEMNGNTVSQPSTASPHPSTMDRLKSFFGGGQSQPQQQAPQQAAPQSGAPMSFEEFKAKKAAGSL